MKIASLGSGSKGNALIVVCDHTAIMIDCGLTQRALIDGLSRLGLEPKQIQAIFLTHEHIDHSRSAVTFAKRHDIKLYLSAGTLLAINQKEDLDEQDVQVCRDEDNITVGSLTIKAYTVSHDANEPLQYCICDDQVKFGILTDTGYITDHISQVLASCHGLLLECNYDERMLSVSDYPLSLKQRIASEMGHLSNRQARDFLKQMDLSSLRQLIAGHLSQNNNHPKYVEEMLRPVVQGTSIELTIATQETGFNWIEI